MEKNQEILSELIGSITYNNFDNYDEKYMKIRFNSNDDLHR